MQTSAHRAAFPLAACALWLCFAALPARAQDSKLADGPPPPPPEETTSPAPAESAPPVAAEPAFDPLRAAKSMEVGNFYLKKGDYDAAIDRFEEAARLQPKVAKPFLLLGEAYEKKDDRASAIAAYRKYLELYRTAPDREKITKRIEKLASRSERHGSG